MRLHSTENTWTSIYAAAEKAGVVIDRCSSFQSKSREFGFDVILSGDSKRRQNVGKNSGGYEQNFAATWDQWGVFLGHLYNIDPAMICGIAKRPDYADENDFNRKTDGRFADNVMPEDAHGDHVFRSYGMGSQKCLHCSARKVW